jgi:hypothetical protein
MFHYSYKNSIDINNKFKKRKSHQRRAAVVGCCRMPTALTTNDIFFSVIIYLIKI